MDKKNKKKKIVLKKVGKTTVEELKQKEAEKRVDSLKKQLAEKRASVKPVKFNKNMSLNLLKKLKPEVKKYNDVLIAQLTEDMVATKRLTKKYIISLMEQDSNEKLFASEKGGLEKKLSDNLRDIIGKNLAAKKTNYVLTLVRRKANAMSGNSRIAALIRQKEKEEKEKEKEEAKNPKRKDNPKSPPKAKGKDNPLKAKGKDNPKDNPKSPPKPKKKRLLNISLIMKKIASRLRERDLLLNLIKKHGSKGKVMSLLENFIIKRHEGDKTGFKDEEDVAVFFANKTNEQILKLI